MEVTVLIDNNTEGKLKSEWGLSFLIDYKGNRYLLDAGKSAKFYKNAKKLGLDIKDIEYAVLSHAHYDHADGFRKFLRKNKHSKLYVRDAVKENAYKIDGESYKYIGICKGILDKYENRICYASGDYQISDGVYLIPHKTEGLDETGKLCGMYIYDGEDFIPDSFKHEQSLVFDTDKGLVIFNSCSHGGADNIINEVSATFPDKKIYALLGGFHLYKRSDDDVKALCERLLDTGIEHIYTGHCTGERAFNIMKDMLGDKVLQIYSGMNMTF